MRKSVMVATLLALACADSSFAAATPEQKCQAAKNLAAGQYAACRQTAEKGLALTGDATKYGAAIDKCEAKFGTAWQKAIDKAADAGATCPDAPLTAGQYQAAIDAQAGNIATALAGGGLTTPDTCGSGTIEAGESCDFGPLQQEPPTTFPGHAKQPVVLKAHDRLQWRWLWRLQLPGDRRRQCSGHGSRRRSDARRSGRRADRPLLRVPVKHDGSR